MADSPDAVSKDREADAVSKDREAPATDRVGPLSWMVANPVAANVLMIVLLVGGLLLAPSLKKEVFPEVQLDLVTVEIRYPGASPEDVEKGVILAVEEAVRGVDGVKEVRATAGEGYGLVIVELLTGVDHGMAFNDVTAAVDRVRSFPAEMERPVVSLASNRREVVSLILYGDVSRDALYSSAQQTREGLLAEPGITQVEIFGSPPPEVSIEVPQQQLRRHGLTLPQVAAAVRQATVDLPGGHVETRSGEVLVRTQERRVRAEDFADVSVRSTTQGGHLRLRDIATLRNTFRDTDLSATFDGQPALQVKVFRVGDEGPVDVASAVRGYVDRTEDDLPPGVHYATWNDASQIFGGRIELLLKNAAYGLVLMMCVLTLFLKPRVAFWVTLGLPVSFLGAFLVLPVLGVSINMISLFALILVLGIVVDDAIVVGEAVYSRRVAGEAPKSASTRGVREVAAPVVFAVATSIIAFVPMLTVPGVTGKFFRNIPLVVIPILAISLVESLLVLPAHLAHVRLASKRSGKQSWLHRVQKRVDAGLGSFVQRVYDPLLGRALDARYLTIASALGLLLVSASVIASGRVKFNFLPAIEGELVQARVELPFGAPVAETQRATARLVQQAHAVLSEHEEQTGEEVSRGIYAVVGQHGGMIGRPEPGAVSEGGHLSQVGVYLTPSESRSLGSESFADEWRSRVGDVVGVKHLTFTHSIGPPAGRDVSLELSHPNPEMLQRATQDLERELARFTGVYGVGSSVQRGKEQLDLELSPAARALGVTEADLAAQVRGAFFGAEALRDQRGRDEIVVYARLPEAERLRVRQLETLMIRTPGSGEIPMQQAAKVHYTRSDTTLTRRDGHRIETLTADVDRGVTTGGQITEALRQSALAKLTSEYPGLRWAVGGEREEQAESLSSLGRGMAVAFVAMFGVMAIALGSFAQPVLILVAIPFGLVGALLGHVLLGFDLSIISVLGMVALAGVVVNDSLVLIYAVNDARRESRDTREALVRAAKRRFRPILLTSLTTFFGLAPMISETSLQARFLVPMAISLGFGVLFVTVIALLFVPAAYHVLEDVRCVLRRLAGRIAGDVESTSAS